MKIENIKIIQADITTLAVDAVVNAANSSLLGGGGVDGAIHRVAGAQLLEECRLLGGCATGAARITKGYNLPAKFVIHTVGPVWMGGEHQEDDLLASCYKSCFVLAKEYSIESIAFPAISTGVYGFPKKRAAKIAIEQAKDALQNRPDLTVHFVCFDQQTMELYERKLLQCTASAVSSACPHTGV